ncbi:hypothetical protein TRICI_000084 [Trichomonascus ciferrii]|uniref:Uncharacterized protein n=1 Tax=Trichomonascus ciferrii TaxID=44093 RepID=A0A642VEH4_9ASCO|nr:hypothetical protein TRICI_000084 [Trichomonascus ciferrii]
MRLTVPGYQRLLAQVVNFSFYETEIETVRAIAHDLTGLQSVTITGRATAATLSLLDTAFSHVPRVFISGALEHIETLLDYPQLCPRLVNISTFFGVEQDHETLALVGRSLRQLESLSLINRVNPRLIHVEDLVYLTRELTKLKSIQTSGPLENEQSLDWIPDSVVEFTVSDDELGRSEGINVGRGVQRLVLQIGDTTMARNVFRFPQLEHLEVHMNDDEEMDAVGWVQQLARDNAPTLRSVHVSTKDADSQGLEVLKQIESLPQLESLVIDLCCFEEGSFFSDRKLSLPKLDYFALHSIPANYPNVSSFIKDILNAAPKLEYFFLDEPTCSGLAISITGPASLQLFDKFNNLREFSMPKMYRVKRNQFI